MPEPEIVVLPTADALAAAVAERLVTRLTGAQQGGEVPAVGLTGGSIAIKIHEAIRLASGPDLDWSAVDVWWGDERYVPSDDGDRNARQARDALLDHVDVSPDRVHEMPASDGGHAGLAEAAAAYGDEVRTYGRGAFDVLMLGLGPDGHVASLFPGHPALDVEDAVAVPVTDSPKPPPERISLSFGTLNSSREVWFVVSGAGKADAVARALGTGTDRPDRHEIPAVGVSGREHTVWFLDEDSAAHL